MSNNVLYYGDNLDVLRRHFKDKSETVDLIYLDPPFNSNATYNVLFSEQDGTRAAAQIKAFEDTWRWDQQAEHEFQETVGQCGKVADALIAFRTLLGESNMMAYLAMMAPRLLELRRVLKPAGSIYLHCDPTASHYLKLLMDAVFGPQHYRNEIIWKRASAHNDPKRCGQIHDTLLFYSKAETYTWNPQYTAYSQEYLDAEWNELPSGRYYKAENMLDPRNSMAEYDFMGTTARWRTGPDKMLNLWNAPQTEVPRSHGRIKLGRDGKPTRRCRIIFLDELPGVPLQSIWGDVLSLRGGAAERLGYPTQKPSALLERIIQASSNEGDVVLDPFCGCGTAISAAQKLNRRWIGIDVTHLAINLIKFRLLDEHKVEAGKDYQVIGEPTDLSGARELAAQDPFQFQSWALGLVGARVTEQKKGADKGIDGRVRFFDEAAPKPKQVILSVKAGHTGVAHVRDLRGVVDREKAEIGVLITMQEPTQPMKTEAASAGFYQIAGIAEKYPKLQIRTIRELLDGKGIDMPSRHANVTFKKAPRAKEEFDQLTIDGPSA
jgi:DNA modification methylase